MSHVVLKQKLKAVVLMVVLVVGLVSDVVNSAVVCVCVFVVLGVNLLIGTDGGMMLLDRSGQGKGATA